MNPLKVLDLDGVPSLFYQHFLPKIITKTVLDFLNHGVSPPKFNETHIVLTPKVTHPRKVFEY